MTRSGWCRECGEWVWVDDEGACQHGHGSECVERIHDAEPASADFGRGDMPAELNRFNWGAFALPLFWAFAYGAWPIASWWLFSLIVPLLLAAMFGIDGTTGTLSGLIAVSAAAEVINGLVRLWAGTSANRLVWMRENRRLAVFENAKPRFTVEAFLKRQRVWATVGWVLLIVALVFTSVLNSASWKELGFPVIGAVEPAVWLIAEVLLGVWLAGKAKQEREPREAA